MKLDRNTNPDGRGRYALIHLRCTEPEPAANGKLICDRQAVSFGNEGPGEQFFVLKYKDKFAAAALWAYANAVDDYASQLWSDGKHEEYKEFVEFAEQIKDEAEKAEAAAIKTPTPLKP